MKHITFDAALASPGQPQLQIFSVNANIAGDGIYHEYFHVRTPEQGTHLHVGWNPTTSAGLYNLTDHAQKPLANPTHFTTDAYAYLGEWRTWTNDTGTYGRIGMATANQSTVWTTESIITPCPDSAATALELPGTEGIIAYVPDVTATYTQWSHLILPHNATMTATGGPGLIIIAWAQSIELLGHVVKRSNRPPRIPGEERLERYKGEGVTSWINRPQGLYQSLTDHQQRGLH
ncbi:MAG: hypothetical protein SGJ01_14605 [Gemmatimonadota bacterium]|nr:hypothetical protein [Gemmatimonadota bacterium]